MMKRHFLLLLSLLMVTTMHAQKTRPDAFPPIPDTLAPKVVNMATNLDEMASWDRYPTYEVYIEMMERFVQNYPTLCRLDTIGTSVQNRLILSLAITGIGDTSGRPEFFYSSTMHGDEVTGFYLMLRLCDTLLSSYGSSPDITNLLDRVRVYINPLSNPDGTYHNGNHTVVGSMRYNANYIDLNRNYPDPFGTDPLDSLQVENIAMINYVQNHHFLLSANLHGGSEVMNYPWDSYTSYELLNEHASWWKEVCKRFVDTCRMFDNWRFRDVSNNGYINGGDWYVIHNGRQDYFNYYCGVRELTMELSTSKTLSTDYLRHYWDCQSHALINYIKEIFTINTTTDGIQATTAAQYRAYPNPTRGPFKVTTPTQVYHYNLSDRPSGVYVISVEGHPVKVVKQ